MYQNVEYEGTIEAALTADVPPDVEYNQLGRSVDVFLSSVSDYRIFLTNQVNCLDSAYILPVNAVIKPRVSFYSLVVVTDNIMEYCWYGHRRHAQFVY